MQTSTQYRKFAEHCERLAKEVQAEKHREALEEMAEAWRMLAEERERSSP
jgi:hypothetical protein